MSLPSVKERIKITILLDCTPHTQTQKKGEIGYGVTTGDLTEEEEQNFRLQDLQSTMLFGNFVYKDMNAIDFAGGTMRVL